MSNDEDINSFEEELEDEDLESAEEEGVDAEDAGEDPEREPSENNPEKKQVPLAVLLEERRKRRELEKKVNALSYLQDKDSVRQSWIDAGYDEDFSTRQAELVSLVNNVAAKLQNNEMNMEIKELSVSDDYFSDAMRYKDELKKIMVEKGVDAEKAYMLLRGTDRRNEYVNDHAQRKAIVRSKEPNKRSSMQSSGGTSEPAYSLSPADKRALSELQKIQPDSKWNEKKYYEMMIKGM